VSRRSSWLGKDPGRCHIRMNLDSPTSGATHPALAVAWRQKERNPSYAQASGPR